MDAFMEFLMFLRQAVMELTKRNIAPDGVT
jgi:hypothetical protein